MRSWRDSTAWGKIQRNDFPGDEGQRAERKTPGWTDAPRLPDRPLDRKRRPRARAAAARDALPAAAAAAAGRLRAGSDGAWLARPGHRRHRRQRPAGADRAVPTPHAGPRTGDRSRCDLLPWAGAGRRATLPGPSRTAARAGRAGLGRQHGRIPADDPGRRAALAAAAGARARHRRPLLDLAAPGALCRTARQPRRAPRHWTTDHRPPT